MWLVVYLISQAVYENEGRGGGGDKKKRAALHQNEIATPRTDTGYMCFSKDEEVRLLPEIPPACLHTYLAVLTVRPRVHGMPARILHDAIATAIAMHARVMSCAT